MRSLFLFCLIGLLLAACPSYAGDINLESTPGFVVSSPTNISKELRLQTDLSYIEESDFTNGLGSVEVIRHSLSVDYSIFNLTYGLSHFNWRRKGIVTFSTSSGGDPWTDLHDLTLQARLLNNSLGKGWNYWLNSQISSSFEQDFPGAVGVGLDGGIAYDFWDGWMVGLTARTVALSALRDDLFGERDLGFAVAVSQRALRSVLRELGIIGKNGGSDEIGFSFAYTTSEKTYRLSPDSPVSRNGYLAIIYSKLGAYLDYSPSKPWVFSIGPEFYYDRKYKVHDSSGKSGGSFHLENGWGGYLRVLYRF